MPKPSERPCKVCSTPFAPAIKHTVDMCSNRCRAEARRRAAGARPLRKPIINGCKECSKCGEWKSVADFPPRPSRSTGLQSACRACILAAQRRYGKSDAGRNARYLRKFGVTVDWYEAALSAQGGGCAICGRPESSDRRAHLAVDHCHATGAPRGLLCWICNSAIGKFADDPERLRRAARYLEGLVP